MNSATTNTSFDFKQVDADLEYASSGIDGPDLPYHPYALKAIRAAEKLRAAIERVADLFVNPDREVPPDGSFVVAHYTGGHQDIDVERIWFRCDGDEPHPFGDWWVFGENAGRRQWGEVLWQDDPACDRGHVHLEVLVPVDEIARALAELTQPAPIETPEDSAAIVDHNVRRAGHAGLATDGAR